MSYPTPPRSVTASLANNGGTATVTVIPAPGAGFALRIVAVMGGPNRNSTGLQDMILRNGVGGTVFWRQNGLSPANGGVMPPYNFPEPGYQLDENTALVLETNTTTAVGTTFVNVLFYIDDYS